MHRDREEELTRRERQIMTALYKHGPSAAADIAKHLPRAPSHTAVRTLLHILESKGHVERRKHGRRFLYKPKRPRGRAALAALKQVLSTFFAGSMSDALAAHLADRNQPIDEAEAKRLLELIKTNRKGDR